jgi:iron(III) transport system substrate-binding protein
MRLCRTTHGLRCTTVLCGVVLGLGLLTGCGGSRPRVVLYCAQDREFAEDVLHDFTRETGIAADPKYDTEANKSVSLYTELVQEKGRPRCDVFWNNEILSTIRLQRQGMLEPFESPAARPFPEWTKAPDHTWQAFAERARVLLVNTQRVPGEGQRPTSLLELTEPRWKDKVAMAKPTDGTTATQGVCLFEVLGAARAREFYRGLKENGVHIVAGNKDVAVGVGEGRFAVGMTDTDDAIAEVKAGRPVVIVYPDRDGNKDHPRLGTLYIPNTLAILRGSPNPEAARKLVTYLLSPGVEKRLAESASHQIPLNPEVKAELPPQIERPRDAGGTVKRMDVDFGKAADLWAEAQTFLTDEFAR